jgi:hypothetical protein
MDASGPAPAKDGESGEDASGGQEEEKGGEAEAGKEEELPAAAEQAMEVVGESDTLAEKEKKDQLQGQANEQSGDGCHESEAGEGEDKMDEGAVEAVLAGRAVGERAGGEWKRVHFRDEAGAARTGDEGEKTSRDTPPSPPLKKKKGRPVDPQQQDPPSALDWIVASLAVAPVPARPPYTQLPPAAHPDLATLVRDHLAPTLPYKLVGIIPR